MQWLLLFIPLAHYTIHTFQSRALLLYPHHIKCSINLSFVNEDLATLHQKLGVYFSPPKLGWTCDCSDQQSRREMLFCDFQGYLIERIQLLPHSLFSECMLWGTQTAHLKKPKLPFGEITKERYMWRGTRVFLANSRQQLPDIWMNEPSGDSSSQPLGFPASDIVEQREAIPAVSWSRFLIHGICEHNNGLFYVTKFGVICYTTLGTGTIQLPHLQFAFKLKPKRF